MDVPNNQNAESTKNDTKAALVYMDLICSLFKPEVKPAKIGINEIGSIATNINKVLYIKVSNIIKY